jgi:hypothetical protein
LIAGYLAAGSFFYSCFRVVLLPKEEEEVIFFSISVKGTISLAGKRSTPFGFIGFVF